MENWFQKLFINEAKSALQNKNVAGPGSGDDWESYFDDTATVLNFPNLETLRQYAFYRSKGAFTELNAPKLKKIEKYAFLECSNLALTSLPSGVAGTLSESTFYKCPKLAIQHIPEGITQLESSCFGYCTALTTITFHSKPTYMSSYVFDHCTNLKTINVPWAEGEVANAPWGATNATINYNYTEG
jgi:hypothetical protein